MESRGGGSYGGQSRPPKEVLHEPTLMNQPVVYFWRRSVALETLDKTLVVADALMILITVMYVTRSRCDVWPRLQQVRVLSGWGHVHVTSLSVQSQQTYVFQPSLSLSHRWSLYLCLVSSQHSVVVSCVLLWFM